MSIANGNWIGWIPQRFEGLTWTDEQTIALNLPYSYVTKVFGTGTNQLRAHSYLVKQSTPFASLAPDSVTGRTRVTLVGHLTPQPKVMISHRFEWQLHVPCQQFISFLREHNAMYAEHYELAVLPSEHVTVVEDRSSDSRDPIPDNVLQGMNFGVTTYATGAVVEIVTQSDAAPPSPVLSDASHPCTPSPLSSPFTPSLRLEQNAENDEDPDCALKLANYDTENDILQELDNFPTHARTIYDYLKSKMGKTGVAATLKMFTDDRLTVTLDTAKTFGATTKLKKVQASVDVFALTQCHGAVEVSFLADHGAGVSDVVDEGKDVYGSLNLL
ncbi:hypothetical protein HDV05_008154 [Chytridiales sp. JEL 0842]|nr:hypothetical protein HDV05_008154 [Chytridiales sp. JEL 0842]